MVNPKIPITGVIKTDNKAYSFHLSDFTLVFLDAEVNSYATSILKPVDEFAQAMSHNGNKMLLHIGKKDFPIVNTMKMGLSSYIVSTSNVFDYDITFYDGIRFVGGTLGKLKHPRGLDIEYDGERQYIKYNDDTQKFVFTTEEFSCEVVIGSSMSEQHNHESRSIVNGNIYFEMIFNKPQTTSSLYRHYGKIRELLSFLTNRKNVGFDEMYLLQKNDQIGEHTITKEVAQVFIKQEKELTQKLQYHNLEFEILGNSVAKLLEILYSPKERKRSYSLGFYPENDERDTIVTDGMVRAVCSALECEIGFVKGIKSEEEKRINTLKKQLKPIIEAHKVSENKLKEKTYSLIESSMSHWSMAASDQIKILYHIYDEEMAIANKSNKVIGDEEIDAFVKYRNDITHGSYRVLDATIAYTTYLLACLVYCCVLTRIGVPRENIKQWFDDGRLLR